MSKTILLDPGHGGSDPGAVAAGLHESYYTLEIALQTGTMLGDAGYEVHYTRSGDEFISLASRNQQARNVNPDLYLSIHVNAGGGTGCEAYISNNKATYANAQPDVLAAQMSVNLSETFGFPNRGLKAANFYTFNNTVPNAILIELGFIDHDYDRQQLTERTAEFATVLANVIRDWMPIEEPQSNDEPEGRYLEGDAQAIIDKMDRTISSQADDIAQYMQERDEARADLGKLIRLTNRLRERSHDTNKALRELIAAGFMDEEDKGELHDINVKWAGKV